MKMTMNFKTVSRLLLSVVIVMFTTAIVWGAEQSVEKCPKTVKVLVEEIKGRTFLEYKDLEKTILPWKSDEFKSPIAGGIKKVETTVGSEVKTGDVLILLNDASIKKEIAAAKADLNKWKKELSRREHWKVRSERAEGQAKRNIKTYTDLLAQKEEELKKIRLTSPADGRIDALKVKEGDFISEGFLMGIIVNIDKVVIPLDTYGDMVSEGQEIKIDIKELSRSFDGVVRKDAQGMAFIYIENPEKQILHGMTAQFRVLAKEHKNAVVLPREKILKDEDGDFVYVVNGKYAAKAALKIGPVEKGMALIPEGLAIGDEMIVSEVLSAKQGTLKEKMPCVSANKKIDVLVFDEARGKYVKQKKVKPAAKPMVKKEKKVEKAKPLPRVEKKEPVVKPKPTPKPKPVKKETEPRVFKKFRIGATVGFYKMSDANFDDVYGAMTGFGLDISYMLSEKLDIWFYGGASSKTTAVDWTEEDLKFRFTPFTLDARYFFKRNQRWDFFAGAGLNIYPFKDTNPIEDVKDNAFGFNILGGTYFNLNKTFALQFILRYNLVKKTIENADNDLNMNSLEALLGIAVSF
jgi:RND family efflux transporter MFP subunit